MLIKKKKIDKFFIILIAIFITILIYLLSITPGFKGDLEQSLRILLKQPVLLKSKSEKNNKILDYSSKIFFALENRIFNFSNFDNLKIDINFNELEKLRYDRKKALELRQLDKPQKVRINIIYKGKKYPATARLKGDLSEHWGNIKQWSLRIKLRNKKTIFSMNEFSISVFSERDFPYNFVISDILKKYKILTPRYKTIKVTFNGDDWGLMLLEEQFHDSFYAINKIKEAPIFKMTNENDFLINTIAKKGTKNIDDISKWQGKLETKLYNQNEILKKTNIPNEQTNNTLVSIFKNLQEIAVLNDQIYKKKINKHIDIKSFARAAAITAIFGDWHSILPTNSRYYLSPYNLKVKPILTDSVHSEINENFFNQHNLFYKNIFKLEEFQKEYLKVIKDVDKNFHEIEEKFFLACKDFGKNCENLVELDILKKNIQLLIKKDKNIFDLKIDIKFDEKSAKNFNTINNQNLNKKKINFRVFDNGEIYIDNLTSESLFIEKASLNIKNPCKKNCKKESTNFPINLILKPSTYNKLSSKKIKIDHNTDLENFLEIKYLDERKKIYSLTEKVEKIILYKKYFFESANEQVDNNLLKIGKNYFFKKGIYEIKNPVIIPEGHNLIVESGSIFKMAENTYFMIRDGVLKLNGKKDDQIIFESLNDNKKWKGIYVNSETEDKEFSVFEYVKISDYSFFNNSKIQLTGGVNLINGNFKLTNSLFENSQAEDAINLVNSNFDIENLKVNNSYSDGIDIDFGEGKIINSDFQNIKGDAIDLSGSKVFLKNINTQNISDKAISAGEESNLLIDQLQINSSRIGIASKDSSKVEGSNIKISNCGLFDFAVYQKKSYFKGAYLNVDAVSNCKESIAQVGSQLFINDKKFNQKIFDVKKLYDGSL